MFEAQVAYYLNKYLGKYVEDIDERSLTISIYEGNVVLKNLRLKPDALAELDLPITVKAGLLGSLTLKVPWSSLGRVPVDVTIDRLYILAAPREDEAGCSKEDTIEALITAFQESKLTRVARQESQWIDELRELEQKKDQAALTKSEAGGRSPGGGDGADTGSGGGGGFLRGLIDTILGNLQFSISNVHVRYEDAETHPGQPFACGLTLEKMSGSTVDELGRPAFITSSPLDLLRKALLLRRIALYFDCNVSAWDPGQIWKKVPPAEWEGWFQPGIALDGIMDSLGGKSGRSQGSGARTRHYLLQPVDGRAMYTRRGRNVHRTESEPASEIEISLDAVAVALTQQQYRSYSLLLSEVSTFTARLPQLGYRPKCRPSPGSNARMWWKYAGLAVKQQIESRKLTWNQVVKFGQQRRQYVALYVKYLNGETSSRRSKQLTTPVKKGHRSSGGSLEIRPRGSPAAGVGVRSPGSADVSETGEEETAPASFAASVVSEIESEAEIEENIALRASSNSDLPEEILTMDAALPEQTIIMFRRLAYAEVQRMRKRAAKAAAAAGKTEKQSSDAGGGWLGWLMGAKPATNKSPRSPRGEETELLSFPPALDTAKGAQRADLSEEEFTKLIELVSQQEEGLKLGIETPYSLITQITVRVGSASAVLYGIDGGTVLRGSLEGISAAAAFFPVTHRIQLGVTAMGVESPEGVFLQTGAEEILSTGDGSRPMEIDRAGSIVGEMRAITSHQALAVSVVQRPQDNSADLLVDVILTPSYVYYSAGTVDRVVKFFTPPRELQALDFTTLSAAATSQLERARRAAAEYAAAALSNKPRLRMRLDLEAPKVAIPVKDAQGEVSLALDLGRFIIETDHSTAAMLPPEEAGLYECIKLTGSNVSAYAVDGAFDWASLSNSSSHGTTTSTSANKDEKGRKKSPSPLLVPLLDRCGMEVGLQAARYPDPKYPMIRLSPTIPVLHFHVSPGRIGRLLRVINGALPSAAESAQGTLPTSLEESKDSGDVIPLTTPLRSGDSGLQNQESENAAWRARADVEGPIKILTWSGIGRATATWCPRHAVLYQGKLYLYEQEKGDKVVATVPIWPDKVVLHVPQHYIGGCQHVLAITDSSSSTSSSTSSRDVRRVVEDSSSTIVRFDSEETAAEWYRALLSGQQTLQSLAAAGIGIGIGGGGGTAGTGRELDWEVASSTISSSDAGGEDTPHAAAKLEKSSKDEEEFGGTTREAELEPPSVVVLQVHATLGEFAIFCSGREPASYWPPDPPSATRVSTQDLTATGTQCGSPFAHQANAAAVPTEAEAKEVDGEVSLVILRASGGSLGFEYGTFGMTIHTVLGSLDILDALVGRKNAASCFMACSSRPSAGAVEVDEDVFFDPVAGLSRSLSNLSTGSGSGTSGGFLSPSASTPRKGNFEAKDKNHEQDLAEFTLKLRRPDSKEYEGVDTALDVTLNTLYFYCNRPTVAALIAMGLDVGAVASAAFGTADSPAADVPPSADSGGIESFSVSPGAAGESTSATPGSLVKAAEEGASSALGVEKLQGLELLSDVGLPQGAKRTMFAMNITLSTLQVVLNYEGMENESLAEACITDFSFGLSVLPDGGMEIQSALGNVSAVDCTLPEESPYRQACGLRPGSDASLISLTFASHPKSHKDARVPPGFEFYTLQAKLNELQLVFLYRFLQENLLYITTMLAMRPPPLVSSTSISTVPVPGEGETTGGEVSLISPSTSQQMQRTPSHRTKQQQEPAAAAQPEQQQLLPFILAMDVEMCAPVISMPRSSSSGDAIEVDLGVLRLITTISGGGKDCKNSLVPPASSLLEKAELTFSGVGLSVVQAGHRGHSVVKNPEQGWKLGWKRPLIPLERGDVPYFDFFLDVPFIKASITDAEYLLMTSVAVDNVNEEPTFPVGAQWIAEQCKVSPASAAGGEESGLVDQLQHKLGGETPPQSPRKQLVRTLTPSADSESIPLAHFEDKNQVVNNRIRIRTVISLGEVELELRQSVEGLPEPLPLARFGVANLYVLYQNTESGAMHVETCIPKVEAQDLRPEIPPEQSLAISSGHKASFLMLQWDASPGMVSQSLGIILQKPLFVAELSFLLSVTRFVLPTFSFVKSTPIPFATYDILLKNKESFVATDDAWLSPASRLCADSPGVLYCEYDGTGIHSLVLPSRDHLDELLPLILIGPGCTLRLKNLTLVNADSLAACLQLAPGARLLAQPSDGVKLVDWKAGYSFKGAHGPVRPQHDITSHGTSGTSAAGGGGGGGISTEQASGSLSDPPGSAATTPLDRSIKISVNAVGVGLQLMQIDQERQNGGGGGGGASVSRSASVSLEVAVPGGSGGNISRTGSQHHSASDLFASSSDHGIRRTPSIASAINRNQQHSQQQQPRSIRLLTATMDIDAEYESSGLMQKGHVEIQGLRAETRTIANADKILQDVAATDLVKHKKVRGKKESVVLQPCRLVFTFDLRSEVAPGAETPQIVRTNVDLKASDLKLTVSPIIAELATSLGAGALEPLMQPGPSVPLRAVRQFERVWSIDPDATWQKDSELAVSLAVTGASGGVTIWRPETTTGYGITGHVITAGDTNPSFEVMTVAVNSGLVAYPASFKEVWSGGGATVWRPVPPEGYVSVGDVATCGENSTPPELSEVLCLHHSTLVEVPVGECLPLPAVSASAPAAAARATASLAPVDFWCVDNTMGTFIATTTSGSESSRGVESVQGRDLRSPSGLTPAALVAQGAAIAVTDLGPVSDTAIKTSDTMNEVKSTSQETEAHLLKHSQQKRQKQTMISKLKLTSSLRELFDVFQASRRQKRTEEVRRTLTPAVVDFRRVWSDQGAYSEGEGVTFWRPVAPPGYAALGDCVVRGFHPPSSCLVIREEYSGDASKGGRLPLIKAPRDYELVWSDGTQKEDLRLCFWKPIPHEGYVAMGCVASIGMMPPRKGIKCVRKDAAVRGTVPRMPIWAVRASEKSIPPFSLWSVDETLGTFVVDPTDSYNTNNLLEKWKLKVTDEAASSISEEEATAAAVAAQQAGHGVDVIVNTGCISVLLLDALQVPVVEIETASLEAGVHGPSRQVVQAYLGLRPGITAFNGSLKHWEPVVEPVDIIFKCDANLGRKIANGIEPGIHIAVKSSAEMVYTTFATSHAVTILAAMDQWKALQEGKAQTLNQIHGIFSVAGDSASLPTTVVNKLGIDAALELDYGDRMGLAKLPAGEASPVLRPLPQFPRRRDSALLPRESLPHDLLLIDIDTAAISAENEGPGSSADNLLGLDVYCLARLEGLGVDGSSPPNFGLVGGPRTRALAFTQTTLEETSCSVHWSERLVLLLPSRPSPAHTLVLELRSAKGGGSLLGSAKIEIPAGELVEREAHELYIPIYSSSSSSSGSQTQQIMLCMLRGTYMLQHPWKSRPEPTTTTSLSGDASSGSPSDQWDTLETTVGQRALSIATKPGLWAVVPTTGQARALVGDIVRNVAKKQHHSSKHKHSAADATTSSLEQVGYSIPIRVDDQDVVIEGKLHRGEFTELLRALCQVVNSTAFTLEACLIVLEDGDWTDAVPLDAPATRVKSRTILGRAGPGETLPLPLEWNLPGRQLLIRPVVALSSFSTTPSRSSSAMAEEPRSEAVGSETGGEESESVFDALQDIPAVHDWSVGASGGYHTLQLDTLDEGITRLVSCAPLPTPAVAIEEASGGGNGEVKGEQDGGRPSLSMNTQGAAATSAPTAASSLWFSITIETEILGAAGKRGDPFIDWRIVIAPPITIANQLPLPGSLIVWEHVPGSGKAEAVAKLSERVPSGGQVAIHTADVRKTVSFTLYPEGYDWADASPAILSTGFVRQVRPPPDRFRLVRPGSRLPVEVFLQRDYQLGPWVMLSQEAIDPGAVVARGVPLAVTLLAPLWVVNATGLAIDAAVVPVAPPPQQPSKIKEKLSRTSAANALASAADPAAGGSQLAVSRVLRTSNAPIPGMPPPQDPAGRRTIAPVSMELLSFPLPSFAGGSGSSSSSSAAADPRKRQHYGVRLRVAGSGWTQPLTIDAVDTTGSGTGSVDTLQNAQPVLIQAEAREYGVVYEVTARLEITPYRNSQVLRLEPHVVITNRTAVPLQILQCRPTVKSPVATTAFSHHPGAVVIPEGGVSVLTGSARGVNALPVAGAPGGVGGAPALVRPMLRSVSGRSSVREESIWKESDDESDVVDVDSRGIRGARGSSTMSGKQAWRGVASMMPAAALVQLPAAAQRASQEAGAILDLPAGTTAVPLHLVQGMYSKHVLCFRYGHSDVVAGGVERETTAASSDAHGNLFWSRPFSILHDKEDEECISIPVAAIGGSPSAFSEGNLAVSSSGGSPGVGAGAGVALLRLSVHSRGPGTLHVVLESVNSDPPFLLENRTPYPLHYRQAHIPSAPFHTLPPLSAAGYTWEYSIKEGSSEIEIQEGLGIGASILYQLETAEGRAKPLPLSASPHQCTVRVGFAEAVSTDVTGVVAIGGDAAGGALGRGGIDKVLQIAPGKDPIMLAGLKGIAIPPPEVLTTVEIPGLEVSIVDSLPQEVLLLTVSELRIQVASGLTPVGPFKSVKCSLKHLQADNQLPGSRYPVTISAARTARRALPMLNFMAVSQVAGARGRTFYPFIGAMCPENVQVAISEPLVWRFASIAQQLAQASSSSGVRAGDSKDGGNGDPNNTSPGSSSSAAADLPLRIRHLNISNIGLNVSFQGDPLTRPRHLAGGMVALVIDLANFQAAPIVIHGFDRVEIRTMRSTFVNYLYQWFSTELFGIAISLVRNFGVIGGASKVLSMLSAGVAKLTGDQKGALARGGSGSGGGVASGAPSSGTAGAAAGASSSSSTMKAGSSRVVSSQPSEKRSIADVSDGLLEGAGAFGSSILRGFRGIVEKPLQGAKQSGVEGAMKGIAKGLVGIVSNPVSGALDALSATAEGVDAALSSKNRENMLVMGRKRLPRVVGGDGKLTPMIRDGSDREAVIEQLGSALLRATLLSNPQAAADTSSLGSGAGGKRPAYGVGSSSSILEAYEEHFVLPNDAVALLTNRSLLLVAAPGFAQLNGAAEIGAVSAAEVSAGEVLWVVRWEDVLALELRWSNNPGSTATSGRYPDQTPQASQVKLVAQKVLRRYYQDPVRQDAQWAERHAARAALPADQPPDQLPLTLPSLDFVPTWHTNPNRVPVVYFWKPIAPPGYHPAGDVATLGDEPPLHPVPCFRDDNTLRMAVKAAASGLESSFGVTIEEFDELDNIIKKGSESGRNKILVGDAGKEKSKNRSGSSNVQQALPPTVPPLEYTLIWRYNGERSVSMWMPVAPPGYAAMGAVVVGGPSVPSVDEYLCVRTDLTQSARVFDSPIWAYDPIPGPANHPITPPLQGSGSQQPLPLQQGYQPEAWKVAIWPVDSRLGTFIVVRALNKPPSEVARSVIEVELKEMAKEGQHH
ncbi:hypothetical protein Ndes2437A_g02912 [Nannochloris sp. 'desiccata']